MNHVLENSLVLAALFIVICIPVSLAVYYTRKRKKKKIAKILQEVEQTQQLSFEHQEQLDSFVIALDPDKKVLVQLHLKDNYTEQLDLSDTMSCTLEEKKQGQTLQLIQLVLRNKNQQTAELVFYKQYHDNEGRLKRSAKLATQWNLLINQTIRFTVS